MDYIEGFPNIADQETRLEEMLTEIFETEYSHAHLVLKEFVDTNKGVLNVPAYMNLRDALSHLRRALDNNEPLPDRYDHVVCAREHIRRAATESYQVLFEREYKELEDLYQECRCKYASDEGKPGMPAPLDHTKYVIGLRALRELLKECRRGKDGSTWQQLTEDLIKGCETIRALASELEKHKAAYGLAKWDG